MNQCIREELLLLTARQDILTTMVFVPRIRRGDSTEGKTTERIKERTRTKNIIYFKPSMHFAFFLNEREFLIFFVSIITKPLSIVSFI